MKERQNDRIFMPIQGQENPIDIHRIVLISDGFVMESMGDPSVTERYPVKKVETGQSAREFAESASQLDQRLALVSTAKHGGDFINAEYIDDVHSNLVTLNVDPKSMSPDVMTTYTGTEMSQQIEQAVVGDKGSLKNRGRQLPDISGIESADVPSIELSME